MANDSQHLTVRNHTFRLDRHIGDGGTAVVKKGVLISGRGQQVALKIIPSDGRVVCQLPHRVEQEVKSMRALPLHPNIIRLYGYDLAIKYEGKECAVLVQELASHGELFDYLRHGGGFTEPMARYILKELMEGLVTMHDTGYAHRDLKPENVLLGRGFQLKIADFGFTTSFRTETDGAEPDGAGSDEEIYMQTKCGTKGYSAPEIRTGSYDHKVDFFALGVILFVLVSGFQPFRETKQTDWWFDKLMKGQTMLFWNAHTRKQKFSKGARKLIEGMLNPDPLLRFGRDEILNSDFMQGLLVTKEEYQMEMRRRYRIFRPKEERPKQPKVEAVIQNKEITKRRPEVIVR